MLLNKEYNESADLYSFGIVLWELLTQEEPFGDVEDIEEMIDRVCVQHERPSIPNDCPQVLANLIKESWDPSPEKRPTFQHILDESLLDKAVIEQLIPDPKGRTFWEKSFVGLESVSWAKFVKGFCSLWKLPMPTNRNVDFKCLQAVLAGICRSSFSLEIKKMARYLLKPLGRC